MKKMLGTGVILAGLLVVLSEDFSRGPGDVLSAFESVIEVSCPDPEGCFRVIERAIAEAPSGVTLQVHSGVYYEKPLIINKSLRIEGVPTETGSYPRIVLVDIGTAVLIEASSLMTVELQRLSVEALARDPIALAEESLGIEVRSQTSEGVNVMLREVDILSYTGIGIWGDKAGDLMIEVEESTIEGATGISMAMGHLAVRKSVIDGPWDNQGSTITFPGIILKPGPWDMSVELSENDISGFDIGIIASTSSQLNMGRINMLLENNTISANRRDGIVLWGNQITAELIENEIISNGEYGIKLALPSCMSNVPPELRFQGVIKGVGNRLANNQWGNLCPSTYPWPQGFTMP